MLNDELRGPGSFRMAIRAVKEYNKLGIPVNISTTVSDRNFNGITRMLRLAEELGAAGMNLIRNFPLFTYHMISNLFH